MWHAKLAVSSPMDHFFKKLIAGKLSFPIDLINGSWLNFGKICIALFYFFAIVCMFVNILSHTCTR